MFRQGLRSSAGLARRVLPRASVAVGGYQRLVAQQARPVLPAMQSWKAIAQVARTYSSEATAEAASQSPVGADGTITEFAALENIVDRSLLSAITGDMGYATMTPVQSKTINPALKGTDM